MESRISPFVLIRGAGEMASAIAWRLRMANIRRLCLVDLPNPIAVRRGVSFCNVLKTSHPAGKGTFVIEGVEAVSASNWQEVKTIWKEQKIAVLPNEEEGGWIAGLRPDIFIDAVLAKENLGTTITRADLVIALGPGFEAGKDSHLVIETNRGHDLGKIISKGYSEPNTGIPGNISGQTEARVLRSMKAGTFQSDRKIGHLVKEGDIVGIISGSPVRAKLDGVIRGLIRSETQVPKGLKIGDIDPRGNREYCFSISDKARTISGSVLECVLRFYN